MDIYNIFTIMGIHLLALAVPGPDFLLTLRISLAFGYRCSVMSSFGIGSAIVIWVFLAAFGLKKLFDSSANIQIILMILSGFYLLYISYTLFNSAKNSKNLDFKIPSYKSANSRFFMLGFLTNLSNPKAIFYFASIFALFISNDSSFFEILALVVVIGIESVLFFILIGRIFSINRAQDIFLKNRSFLDFICALVFLFFSFVVFYESFLKMVK